MCALLLKVIGNNSLNKTILKSGVFVLIMGFLACQQGKPLPPPQPVSKDLQQSLLDAACNETMKTHLKKQIEEKSRFLTSQQMENYLKRMRTSIRCNQ